MTTILAGQAANISVTVQVDGAPVAIDPASTVTAQLFALDGVTSLSSQLTITAAAAWSMGVVAVTLDSATTGALPVGTAMLLVTSSNPGFAKRFSVSVEALAPPVHSSLFIKDFIVDELRADRLMAATSNFLSGVTFSDSYLWDKVRAAESEIAHKLRVSLVPTKFFPVAPTDDQLAAIGSMPWAIDPAYDYEPDMFYGEKWGFVVMRNTPVISIDSMIFAYPSMTDGFVTVPADWIRIDAKYGHLRLVPASPALFTTMNAFIMTALAGARTIPFMLQIAYTAGLADARNDYPELIDVIKKLAVLKVIEDSFAPQSGSISADGLSQSISADMGAYRETIDQVLNGESGSNGGLMAKIHGVRLMVS
jgi:hypothetical protein